MKSVLANLHDVLAPGRYCVVVAGDGIYRGEPYPTAHHLSEIATEGGWFALPTITRADFPKRAGKSRPPAGASRQRTS